MAARQWQCLPSDRADPTGRTGIEWGIYGVPETFVLDRNGVIRYRHAGPVTIELLNGTILPLIEKLKAAP